MRAPSNVIYVSITHHSDTSLYPPATTHLLTTHPFAHRTSSSRRCAARGATRRSTATCSGHGGTAATAAPPAMTTWGMAATSARYPSGGAAATASGWGLPRAEEVVEQVDLWAWRRCMVLR
jgi:hypothetical protein